MWSSSSLIQLIFKHPPSIPAVLLEIIKTGAPIVEFFETNFTYYSCSSVSDETIKTSIDWIKTKQTIDRDWEEKVCRDKLAQTNLPCFLWSFDAPETNLSQINNLLKVLKLDNFFHQTNIVESVDLLFFSSTNFLAYSDEDQFASVF